MNRDDDDALEIARYLAQEHGVDGALDRALEGRNTARDAERFYELSIWREVVKLLRDEMAYQKKRA